ncbi:MAG: IS3 family transposase [Lachnospiraceae bacterium]|nr:IS3 family transposase [Lachnospiraceae bacterium]
MKKSHQHSGKRLTEALYTEVSAKVEATTACGRRVSISGMLKKLGVSRSGYRAFLHRKPSASQQRKEAIKESIKQIHDESKQNYGAPKITKELRKSGETIAERTVSKYMKEMGIHAQWVKPWTTTTRDSDFSKELHNILDEQFNPDRPNAVWCTDITYIWTFDGFVYLTSIMDLFARKIIAWTLSETMEVSCVIDTINKAKERRNTDLPLIIHSDRGSQYVSQAYRDATQKMTRSYSHTGYPYDNACIESFHALIKREWLNRFKIFNYSHAYRLVFEYIETFYNTVRIHSHCDYMSPNDFEKLYENLKKEDKQTLAS